METSNVVLLDRKVAALAGIAAKDNSRPALACINVRAGVAAAADGYALMTTELPKENPEDFPNVGFTGAAYELPKNGLNLPARALAAALKRHPKLPKNNQMDILRASAVRYNGNGHAQVVSTNLDEATSDDIALVDSTYPDYAQLFPTAEPTAVVYFDAQRMVTLLQAMIAAGADNNVVRLEVRKPLSVMALSSVDDEGRKTRALLMPMDAEACERNGKYR